MNRLERLKQRLSELLADHPVQEQRGELSIEIAADSVKSIMLTLRDQSGLQFDQCIDICGVDYALYGQSEWNTQAANTGFSRAAQRSHIFQPKNRFAVVYHLLSTQLNHRLRVRVFLESDNPILDSVIDIWRVADWFEREAFDLYGILFRGHPDLRRILTDYGFIGHPFRKDFPLVGQVEMRYDPKKGRVVYEPVSIEQRQVIPRVIRQRADEENADG